jgi:hypothetical protein
MTVEKAKLINSGINSDNWADVCFFQVIGCIVGAPSGWVNLATGGTRLHPLSDPDLIMFCL